MKSAVDSQKGLSLIECVAAMLIIAMVLGGSFLVMSSSLAELSLGKDMDIARLACVRARESLCAARFRATDTGDVSPWLFLGSFELARNGDGTTFIMPDVRAASPSTVDGVGGAVVVEFPVPPLEALPGRTHAGRLILYVDESREPATVPAAGFPFPSTSGLARLDLNGNGTFEGGDDQDIRNGHDLAVSPCRLVPIRLIVEWRSSYGSERYEEAFVLSYQGYR